jgi:hypothetical protein
MKAHRGIGGIAPLISNLDALWLEVVNFMPRPLYSGNEPWCPLNRRLGGAQSRSGSFAKQNRKLGGAQSRSGSFEKQNRRLGGAKSLS